MQASQESIPSLSNVLVKKEIAILNEIESSLQSHEIRASTNLAKNDSNLKSGLPIRVSEDYLDSEKAEGLMHSSFKAP